MQWLFVIPVVLLIATLWWLSRRVVRLRREISEAESRLARRFYTLQGRVSEMDSTVRELDFERRRLRGEVRFDPDTRIEDALAVHPKVREIFAAFGIAGGGCSGPGLDQSQTIADTCRRASLDLGAVLNALAGFVENPAAPIDARVATAKLYRIEKMGRAS